MLSAYSWMDFLTAVGIGLVVYYVVVALRYYPKELKAILSGRASDKIRATATRHEVTEAADEEKDNYLFAEELMSVIKDRIANAASSGYESEELMSALRMVIQPYRTHEDELFRSAVNEYILSQIDQHGAVPLLEDEVELLWVDDEVG